jgi:hypothetical protein
MFKKLLSFIFAERCPQCKSSKIIKTKTVKNYIGNRNKYNYYCCKCGLSFSKYR